MQVFAMRETHAVTQTVFKRHAQAIKAMKLIGIILFIASLQVNAKGFTQTITISVKDASLEEVFKLIEKQTDYVFLFERDLITKAKKVTINVSKPLLEILDLCFKDQPFTYRIAGKIIALSPRREKPEKESKTSTDIQNPLVDLKGRVVNAEGEPISGATVSVKGTQKNTLTDVNGNFFLTGVNENAVIIITHVQYEMKSMAVSGRSSLNATLQIKVNSLDELQVVAYGSTSKRFNTGNVASVKANDIEKQPVNNPLLALSGRVAGLEISQATGFAGSGVKVRIQGVNSIANGSDPLYVVDGVPYTSLLMPSTNAAFGSSGASVNDRGGGYGSPLNFINPSDIESIEVLKDADATSIYGSQAANGAILITTKKGKAGEQKVEFNLQQGWGKVTRKMDLLNTRQYMDMRYEALSNDKIPLSSLDQTANYDLTVWDTTRYTDWQKELIGNTAHYTDLQASVSGGTSNSYYLIGTGYHRETVVIPGDFSDQKATVHFQAGGNSLNQKFQVRLTGNYMADINKLPNTASFDLTQPAITLAPVSPALKNPDGTINWAPDQAGKSTWDNPLAQLLNKYTGVTSNLVGNLLLSYQLTGGFNIKSSFGYTALRTNETVTLPLAAVAPERRTTTSNIGIYGDNKFSSWIIEPQITYERNIAGGKLEALIGSTIQQRNSSAQRLVGTGYISDEVLDDIRAASSVKSDLNFKFLYKYTALFGRITYNWQHKYILNLTARRDGSSRFGENNQFHNFGSVAAAWIISDEKFVKRFLPFLSFGKIKASYGITGNDQIGDYKYLSTYSAVSVGNPYQGINTLQPNDLSNSYLQWEETRKINVGLDLGFFKDRFLINANYFHNRSSNQLLGYALPVTTGFSSITRNFPAKVQNMGLELSLSTINIADKRVRWSTNANITLPNNELISFPNIELSSYASNLVIGEPITIVKKFHFIGVDPTTGIYFFDSKTNPFSPNSPGDATVIINTAPKFYGGLQNNISYNGFELDFLFQFVKQKGRNYSFGYYPGTTTNNQPTYILNRWQKPGDHSSYQRFNSDYGLSGAWRNAYEYSDAAFADASYVRLKNISLSYQVQKKYLNIIHIRGLRIYTQGQNLLTITKYKGLDPETKSSFTLPPLRVLTVGVKVNL
jgi:TonB-linked SusC/RagA family outer membrane protein